MLKPISKRMIFIAAAALIVLAQEPSAIALNINLCPSSANPLTSQAIKLQYIVPAGWVPDTVGDQATDRLDIDQNLTYPVPGLQQKALLPIPTMQFPSCAGIPGAGGTGFDANGNCDGKLVIRVERDGQAISSGRVTVHFVEITQGAGSAVDFLFRNWPNCGPAGGGDGTAPCAANAAYVAAYDPIMGVVGNSRFWHNVLRMANIPITQVTPTEIRTDSTVPAEFLHLLVGLGAPQQNSSWFAFAALDSCVQVSRVLPINHY